jgi:hypothetical protein
MANVYPLHFLSTAAPTLYPAAPVIDSIVYRATSTKVTLNMTLSPAPVYAGSVICAALPGGYVLQQLSDVQSSPNTVGYIVGQSDVSLAINNLVALSTYNVYCTVINVLQNTLPLVDVQHGMQQINTTCCRVLSFTKAPYYIYTTPEKASSYQYTYVLTSRPSREVTVTPVLYDAITKLPVPAAIMGVRPASATFTASSALLQSSFIVVSLKDFVAGNFLVKMEFSGLSRNEFSPASTEFVGLAAAAIKPAPRLASATFTDSGAAVVIVFDTATNRANLGFEFWKCSDVFTYDGAGTATCVWMSSTVVKASFGEYSRFVPFLTIGGSLTLKADKLTAECLSVKAACDLYPKAEAQSITAVGPPHPVAPVVVLTMYSVVTRCDNVSVDSSLSSGHGSRDWKTVSWTVQSTAHTSEIEAYLKSFGVFIRRAISIPSTMFRGNTKYAISLKVTNFLGVESTGTETVFVDDRKNLPLVSILQAKLMVIQPTNALHIFTGVRRSACADPYGISYMWNVTYQNGTRVLVEQTSKDPTELLLKPYALLPGNMYNATVTATALSYNNSAPVSAQNSVLISVVPGNVVAQIAGGSQRNVLTKRGTFVTIDASGSYDANFPERNSSNLLYSWKCIYVNADKFGQKCAFNVGSFIPPLDTLKTLVFPGAVLSLKDSYQFFVVAQSRDGRSGTANVTINALGPEVDTEVQIISSVKKVNYDHKLEVTGTLSASYDLDAQWSAYIDGFPTAFKSLTATTSSFSVGELTSDPNSPIGFPIAIDRNVLSPGSLVTFRLTADRQDSKLTFGTSKYASFCEVTVLINAPPSGGSFKVDPTEGEGLTTLFSMLAPSWSDEVDDLPLLFSFLYRVTSSAPYLQLQAKKGITVVETLLPQGVVSADYVITATAIIFDTPGASVNMSANVVVVPVEIDYLAYLQANLDTSGSSVIDTSVAAATINNVASSMGVTNCSAVTVAFCESLNREPCVNTPNTCGTCKANYIGIVGDINKPCITNITAAQKLQFNESCSESNECIYDECVFGRCSAPLLSCPSDDETITCSGHGSCVYTDPANRVLDTCTQLDTRCTATCNCTDGYGGRACSYDNSTLVRRDQTRQLMCDYFSLIAETSNLSPLLMDAFVGTVLSAYDPAEASANTTASCYKALTYLASYAADGGLKGTKKETADFLLSGATQFVKSASNASALAEALSQISGGVATSMTNGQDPVDITSGGMRMKVVKSQASTVSKLEPPRSAAEKAYDQPAATGMEMAPGSASDCDSGGGYVSISVVQWSSSPFPGADSLETPQMKFESSVADSTVQRRRRKLSHSGDDDGPYSGQTPSYYISFQFNAPKSFDPNIDYVHASPLELSNVTFPECTFFDPESQDYKPCEGCTISSYTNYNVTYGCYDIGSICGGGSSAEKRLRRYLAGDDGTDDGGYGGAQTSITSINFGALLSTFTGVLGGNPLAINFEKAKIIISFVICLVFIIYFGYWYFRRWDIHDRYTLIYTKPDPRLRLRQKIAEQSMKVPLGRESLFTDSQSSGSNEDAPLHEANPMHVTHSLPLPQRLSGSAANTQRRSRFSSMFTRLTDNVANAVVGQVKPHTSSNWDAGLSGVKYATIVDADAEEENEKTAFANEVINNYIHSVMPDERTYSEKTSWTDIAFILMMQHPYTVMFFGPSLQNTRVIRWTSLVCGTLVGLFIDTLIFSTFFPDTGECETYTSEELCLLPLNSALGTPLCTWLADKTVTNGGSCTLTPPPEDMTFTMILVMLTVVISVPIGFALDGVVQMYCKYRPNFSKWGYHNEAVLGGSTQYAAAFNKEERHSTVRILRDNFDEVKREEAKQLTGEQLKNFEQALADKAKRDTKKFNYLSPKIFAEFDTPDSEAIFLLESAKRFLDDNAQRNDLPWNATTTSNEVDEKIASIQENLGIYPDGSPMPLTMWDQYWYGDAKNKLITAIDEARGGAEEIRDALQELGENEMASKEVALIQFFMAEHFSSYKQYILNGHLFAFNNSNPLYVHPAKWLAAWAFIISAQLFFVYWMLMWGVSSGGKTMTTWGINFATGAIQDIFCIAPIRVFIMYVIAMTSIKPQLRHMHRILHIIAMNYVQDKLPDNYEVVKVVQHFSPACRAARMHVSVDLAAGEILRALDDKDANDCHRANDVGLSMVVLAFIAIPIFVGVLTETGGDIALDTALPSFLSMFILANYLAYNMSVFLVILPYALIVAYFLIKWYGYAPALRHVRKLRAEKERRNATVCRTDVASWNVALRSTPLITIAWRKFITSLIDFGAFTIYYMGFLRNVRKKYREYMDDTKEEEVKVQWQIMNLPLPMQARVIDSLHAVGDKHAHAASAAGKQDSRDLWSSLPHRVRKMCPGKDWTELWDLNGEEEEGDYLTDLMNRRWFHVAQEPQDDSNRAIELRRAALAAVPRKLFTSSVAAMQFREFYSFCYEADAVLLHLLFSYRKQLLSSRLYHVSLLDEQTLTGATSMEDLAAYKGVIHVRDLAMMLADLMHYYRPFGAPLPAAARKFIVTQYDKWVGKHCVETVHVDLNMAHADNYDSIENLLNKDEEPVEPISGFYEPCFFAYRIVNDFSGYEQLHVVKDDSHVAADSNGAANHDREKAKAAKLEVEYTVLFVDICRQFLSEEVPNAHGVKRAFVGAVPLPAAEGNDGHTAHQHKHIADMGVPFDVFAHWFLDLNSRLLPRLAPEANSQPNAATTSPTVPNTVLPAR